MRFLVDENFDNRILAGLRRRQPAVDAVRVQDAGLIEELLLVLEVCEPEDLNNQVMYLPL